MDFEQIATILDYIVKAIPLTGPGWAIAALVLAALALGLRAYAKYKKDQKTALNASAAPADQEALKEKTLEEMKSLDAGESLK